MRLFTHKGRERRAFLRGTGDTPRQDDPFSFPKFPPFPLPSEHHRFSRRSRLIKFTNYYSIEEGIELLETRKRVHYFVPLSFL